jgi:putative ABC transport system substrate-binding protein
VNAKEQGITLRVFDVRSQQDISSTFDQARAHAQAVMVLSNPVTYGHRSEVARLAAKLRLPTVYAISNISLTEFDGICARLCVMYKRAAEYIDKILNGANPVDIPIEQASVLRSTQGLEGLGTALPKVISCTCR